MLASNGEKNQQCEHNWWSLGYVRSIAPFVGNPAGFATTAQCASSCNTATGTSYVLVGTLASSPHVMTSPVRTNFEVSVGSPFSKICCLLIALNAHFRVGTCSKTSTQYLNSKKEAPRRRVSERVQQCILLNGCDFSTNFCLNTYWSILWCLAADCGSAEPADFSGVIAICLSVGGASSDGAS